MVGVGGRHIKRIAQKIERAQRRLAADQGFAIHRGDVGVMDLVIPDRGVTQRPGVDHGAQAFHFIRVKLGGVETQHLVQPAAATGDVTGAEIVDIGGFVAVLDQVAQKGAEPGIAGLGVGGQPVDAAHGSGMAGDVGQDGVD